MPNLTLNNYFCKQEIVGVSLYIFKSFDQVPQGNILKLNSIIEHQFRLEVSKICIDTEILKTSEISYC